MYRKVEMTWNVMLSPESLIADDLMFVRSIINRLREDFAAEKATKELGYYLNVTSLEKIGKGEVMQHTGNVLFPVVFRALTFKIVEGEILEGIVRNVVDERSIFLRCGPVENLYLSNMKMSGYRYVPGENPFFLDDKMSKIAKDVVVRCVVIATRWKEADQEFQALVSLEGDGLGPV